MSVTEHDTVVEPSKNELPLDDEHTIFAEMSPSSASDAVTETKRPTVHWTHTLGKCPTGK